MLFLLLLLAIYLLPAIIEVIKWIKRPEDPYKKIRKESTLNAGVLQKINSKPHSHNRAGALTIFEQEEQTGKLSLTDKDD